MAITNTEEFFENLIGPYEEYKKLTADEKDEGLNFIETTRQTPLKLVSRTLTKDQEELYWAWIDFLPENSKTTNLRGDEHLNLFIDFITGYWASNQTPAIENEVTEIVKKLFFKDLKSLNEYVETKCREKVQTSESSFPAHLTFLWSWENYTQLPQEWLRLKELLDKLPLTSATIFSINSIRLNMNNSMNFSPLIDYLFMKRKELNLEIKTFQMYLLSQATQRNSVMFNNISMEELESGQINKEFKHYLLHCLISLQETTLPEFQQVSEKFSEKAFNEGKSLVSSLQRKINAASSEDTQKNIIQYVTEYNELCTYYLDMLNKLTSSSKTEAEEPQAMDEMPQPIDEEPQARDEVPIKVVNSPETTRPSTPAKSPSFFSAAPSVIQAPTATAAKSEPTSTKSKDTSPLITRKYETPPSTIPIAEAKKPKINKGLFGGWFSAKKPIAKPIAESVALTNALTKQSSQPNPTQKPSIIKETNVDKEINERSPLLGAKQNEYGSFPTQKTKIQETDVDNPPPKSNR